MPKKHLVVLDCQACGACCHGGQRHVQVFGFDHDRMFDVLGDAAEHALRWESNKIFLAMRDGHCASLDFADGRYRCTIYQARPDACRALEAGSAQCDAEREIRIRGQTISG